MPASYQTFFQSATNNTPYGYQCRLACGPDAKADDPTTQTGGTDCASQLIDIPTGLGKTAAVVLAWLWNRAAHPEADHRDTWPRRLAYCLPMRTLVEQTRDETRDWIEKLVESGAIPSSRKPRVVVLMGGESLKGDEKDWDLFPEDNCILIGTQDMLLSRALNRGYGMSRFRWPMHFGLLNNDCLWVLDETQLMGSGLWTSAQLDWMRERRFMPQFPVKTWWMSATLGGDFLKTSDRRNEDLPNPKVFKLSEGEIESLDILKAQRPLFELKLKATPKKTTKAKIAKKSAKPAQTETAIYDQLASHVIDKHQEGTLSLIVCNRVEYAQALHGALRDLTKDSSPLIELLTSRFRPQDRQKRLQAVLDFEHARKAGQPHPGLILVSTQLVEAGFDVSATRLWTQLAPWPSILQRLGRLNRDGKSNANAQAFVFEFPEDKKDPYASLPYEKADVKDASAIVSELVKLGQQQPGKPIRELLEALKSGPLKEKVEKALEPKPQPYPRAVDIHGLFSTEPDVFGGFTDVSPWVRNADASADVTVFWRNFEDKGNAVNQGDGPTFQRNEGCPVAVYHLTKFLGSTKHAYQWNSKADKWDSIRKEDIRPGMTLLLPVKAGGYDKDKGWTGPKGGDLGDIPPPGPFEQSDADDGETETGDWVTLETHLNDTEKEATTIADRLALAEPLRQSLIRAAALHDIGKSLKQWQQKLLETHVAQDSERKNTIWAKSPRKNGKSFRPGLRHEAASALAMWQRYYRKDVRDDFPALAIYQVAAHHGKVRTILSARHSIKEANVCGISIPNKEPPVESLPWPVGWQMDFSAAEDGASGQFSEDGTEFIFEAPGWTGLVADLLGEWEKDAPTRTSGAVPEGEPAALGPFALAYFETLLRAADGRASDWPSQVEA